jgi:hypothetical protein
LGVTNPGFPLIYWGIKAMDKNRALDYNKINCQNLYLYMKKIELVALAESYWEDE